MFAPRGAAEVLLHLCNVLPWKPNPIGLDAAKRVHTVEFWPLRRGGNGLLRMHVRVAAVQMDHMACLLVEAGGGALQAGLEAVILLALGVALIQGVPDVVVLFKPQAEAARAVVQRVVQVARVHRCLELDAHGAAVLV